MGNKHLGFKILARFLILIILLAGLYAIVNSLQVRAAGLNEAFSPSAGNKFTYLNHHASSLAQLSISAGSAQGESIYPLEIVGQIGGLVIKPAIQDNFAYLGVGLRVLIFNVANPALPVLVSESAPLPGGLNEIAVEGSYVYVAGDKILTILNVSNPTDPAPLGNLSFDQVVWSISVQDKIAYLLSTTGLHIVDVSAPADPQLTGFYPITGTVEMVVAGDYAYLTSGDSGLRVVDVSEPGNPVEAGFLTGLGETRDITKNGDYVYISNIDDEVRIVQVSNPAAPVLRGIYALPAGFWDFIADISAGTADKLYLATYTGGLKVIEVTDPDNPVERGTLGAGFMTYEVTGDGNYAYAVLLSEGLHIIDATTSTSPSEVASYDPMGGTLAFDLMGDYAYVYDNATGMGVVDLSDPADMLERGTFSFWEYSEGVQKDIAGMADHAYIATNELYKVNISNPDSLYGTSVALDTQGDSSLALSANYAYITNGWDKVEVASISGDPAVVGSYLAPGRPKQIVISGNYSYLVEEERCQDNTCEGDDGLRVLDIGTTPTSPQSLGFYPFPENAAGEVGEAGRIVVQGDYVFVPESCVNDCSTTPCQCVGDGLHIINVANPNAPSQIAFLPTQGQRYAALDIHQGYAFLLGYRHLTIIDISNPETPVLLESMPHYGTNDIEVRGSLLYTTDDDYTRGYGLVAASLPYWSSASFLPDQTGSLTSAYDGTSYHFAPDTFTEPYSITHIYRAALPGPLPEGQISIDHVFEVSVVDQVGNPLQPTQPYSLTIHYAQDELGSTIESTLRLYYWDGIRWVLETSGVLDKEANTLTATPDHFSVWGIFGGTQSLFLPLVIR